MNRFSLFIITILPALLLMPFANIANSKSSEHSLLCPEDYADQWIESKMASMTPDERIGQLFMVAAYSDSDGQSRQNEIANLITKYKIGGLIFMKGAPLMQAQMTNYFQSISQTPLLIGIDGEWGLSMRLSDTPIFPRQVALGAIQDNKLVYDMGREIARECHRLGVHINFAPVVDINSNAKNPVIGDRSFGENQYNVTEKAIAYMQGMEQNGVLACAKHFPGHGDTDKDSHHTLPVIKHDLNRLRSVELYPFQQMIQRGVSAVMIAHLAVPALDASKIKGDAIMPTTLSKKVVTNLLKNEMGFSGLVITDALNMKGVSDHFDPGVVDVKALIAGNDILLFSGNVGKAIEEIKKAINKGDITQNEIDNRVRKILRAKQRVGLDNYKPIKIDGLLQDLSNSQTELIQRQLWENTLTLVRDDYKQIPFKQLESKQFASIAIGASSITPLQTMLGKYAPFAHHTLKTADSPAAYSAKLSELKKYSHVVVSLHQMTRKAANNYGISDAAISFIHTLQQQTNVTLLVFGNPYSLKAFDSASTLLLNFEDNAFAQSAAAQGLFGGIQIKGKLPVTASAAYRSGLGISTEPPMRFKYTMPEEVGIKSIDLLAIDKIVEDAIRSQAMPGCQILIAKDGKVIWDRGYGFHTYSQAEPVQLHDLYDLASITKIAGSMLGIMNMYETKALNIYDPLKRYFPELDTTNKANLVLRDILIHESGLKAWIGFYEETLNEPIRSRAYSSQPNATHTIKVADNMYMNSDYDAMIWRMIAASDLPNKGDYKYSDLGFYFFKKMIEKNAQKPMDSYLSERFYRPLGLSTMGYNPTDRFSKRRITPTENDQKWRKQIVQGTVHDMGAAMLGGVGGHAGLFSNANDLGVLMQMLMNGGTYGGRQYFQPATLQTFTAQQKNGSRRGLGFDKPEINPHWNNPASSKASPRTFGHTGFTGTCAWADPDNKLVFVFLSNRTYPQMNNNKLQSLKVRTRIQDVVYEALEKSRR
jgi:beta-N-acetylhexosaminidase